MATERRPVWLALTCLGFLVIALLFAGRLWWLPAHAPLDLNEGWNAFQAAAAMGDGPLYPAPDALTGNNYPPLSFYIVGLAGRIVGDEIVAGRLVSLAAMSAVAALLFLAIGRLAPEHGWAPPLGAMLFLGFAVTRFRGYVAMDDPQWLGHAFMMAGLLVLLRDRKPPSRARGIVPAAALMLAGGLIKHNLIAFPIAATLWLLVHDRRGLAVWLGASLMIGAAVSLASWWAYGPAIFADLVTADRSYSYGRMLAKSVGVIPFLLPMACVGAMLLKTRAADDRIDLILFTAAVALPFGIVQRSGAGVDYNAHFDALIALCLATPVALARCPPAPPGRAIIAGILLLPLLLLLPKAVKADVDELSGRNAAVRSLRPLEERIAGTPGAVACQDQALCYWAGKGFALDYFLYGQRLRAERGEAMFKAAIAGGRLSAFVVDTEALEKPGDPLLSILRDACRPVFADPEHVLLVASAGRGRRCQAPNSFVSDLSSIRSCHSSRP